MTQNLASFIAHNVPATKAAFIYDRGSTEAAVLTYGEISAAIDSAAHALREAGVVKGSRVALVAGNHPRYFVAFYAIMQIGAVACPINVKLKPAVQNQLLKLCDVEFAFVDHAHLDIDGVQTLSLDEDRLFTAAADHIICPVDEHDLACIMFTSGSTGLPKAVPITHHGYGWALKHYEYAAAASKDLRTLIVAPFFHMNAQATTMLALFFGGTSVLMNGFKAESFLDAIARHKVSEITGVPTMLELAIRKLESGYAADISSVTNIAIGSAPLSENLLERITQHFPGAQFDNGYGTTEGGLVAFGPAPTGKNKPLMSIGYAIDDVDFYLQGSADEGVLWIKSPMTTKGYIGLPQANAEKFRDGFYCTGDIIRKDADGFYYFVGRADDMFVCGGENIYPTEIETVLLKHPDVREAIVVARADDIKGSIPVAFVTLNSVHAASLETSSAETLKAHTLEHLPAYAHPREIYFLSEMPRGTTEKVDRRYLTDLASQKQA